MTVRRGHQAVLQQTGRRAHCGSAIRSRRGARDGGGAPGGDRRPGRRRGWPRLHAIARAPTAARVAALGTLEAIEDPHRRGHRLSWPNDSDPEVAMRRHPRAATHPAGTARRPRARVPDDGGTRCDAARRRAGDGGAGASAISMQRRCKPLLERLREDPRPAVAALATGGAQRDGRRSSKAGTRRPLRLRSKDRCRTIRRRCGTSCRLRARQRRSRRSRTLLRGCANARPADAGGRIGLDDRPCGRAPGPRVAREPARPVRPAGDARDHRTEPLPVEFLAALERDWRHLVPRGHRGGVGHGACRQGVVAGTSRPCLPRHRGPRARHPPARRHEEDRPALAGRAAHAGGWRLEAGGWGRFVATMRHGPRRARAIQ